jgi:hypothetical protein
MVRVGVAAVAALVVLVLVAAAVRSTRAPVERRTLETFARRQRLTVTAANGPLLLQSLTLTRRWRTLGLSTGLACGFLWAVRDGRVTLNFTAAFLGWFVGAVVAEWRIAGLPRRPDGPRAASLERRTVTAYLRPESGALLLAALLVLVGAFVAVVVRARGATGTATGAAGTTATTGQAAAWLLAAVVGLAVVWLTLRRVVTRRQPPAAADLLAADDALRARAANVLAGSAIAAAGVPTASLFALVGGLQPDGGDLASMGIGILVLEQVVGFLVATSASPARTRAPGSVVPSR